MKTYLLMSPQPWGKMYLSKHNYALELAGEGNRVYFLNPPTYGGISATGDLRIREERENLFTIDYSIPSVALTLRFKARSIHDYFIRQTLIKKLNRLADFDELWCFEPNIFSSFQHFRAGKKLLFIVDYHNNKSLKKLAREADGIASISSHILDFFDFTNRPKLLLNHGLNKNFSKFAQERLQEEIVYSKPATINVAYVGNLLQGDRVDRDTLRLIIEQHPEVIFHIYGPSDDKGNSLGVTTNERLRSLLDFLKSSRNVRLHGIKDQAELAREVQDMDVFLTCYNYLTDYNKSSNCHKVIEYLSTGKVVVANRLFAYEGIPELVVMPKELTNENLPLVFQDVISNLEFHNAPDKQRARIRYALENTYHAHIKTLSRFIAATAP